MARRDASDLYGDEHVRKYGETGGEYGHDWREGSSTLLLTTTGRSSGESRTLPLIYGRSGDDYLIVASDGGAPKPPAWFVNLRANPEVEVQVLDDTFRARARVATPEEKPALWREMTSHWPAYDAYQRRTDREIPVVVLERV
jgi:deazaflavin-dependent oxidoreductase (nitroreductase family)